MINLIVACDQNRLIGRNGRLPWSIQEDWEYFMKTTEGGSMIMGKICYQEFEPYVGDRQVIALTKNQDYKFPHALTANCLDSAILMATQKPIWVCGGEAIYREAFPLADRLYLTLIHKKFKGDVYFPPWEKTFTKLMSSKKIKSADMELEFMIFEK